MSKGQCLECNDIIESKHRHDFQKCKCGKSFIDGGDDYIRGGGYLVPVLDALDEKESIMGLTDYTIGDKRFFESGREHEQERILKLLDTSRMCTCKDTCKTDINIYAFVKEELGIDLFELIRGEQNDQMD